MDDELYRIIYSAKRGDKNAFAELIGRYKHAVYRQAAGMLGDLTEAEDAAQEAFIKAYRSLSKLEHEHAFVSWMMRIVSNLCSDRLKRRSREQALTADSYAQAAAVSAPVDSDLRLSIEEAMSRLSAVHREVILLHDVQGYRYEEIAEIAQIPVGTVKSRLFAARTALRNEMIKGDDA